MDYLQNFEKRYENLNQQQKKAVDSIEGPVLVIAGPGSGKTELLSLRVANILKLTDTLPSSILCLTFTDAAAINMRSRLAGLIGQEAYKVAIHTFHSLGTEIINQNPEYFYDGALYSPADQLVQIEIMEEIFSNLPLDNPLSSYHPQQGYTYLKDVLNRISDIKKGGLSPKEFHDIISENKIFFEKALPSIQSFFSDRMSKKTIDTIPDLIKELQTINSNSFNDFKTAQEELINELKSAYTQAKEDNNTKPLTKWKSEFTKKNKKNEITLKDLENTEKQLALAKAYEQYQIILRNKGYFDFQDMILDTVDKLENNPDLRFNIQEKYLYVLVDEFQDTSGVQTRLLDNILNAEINEGRPNILAVGDDDQAIFKFQGANIDNILNFHKKYQDPKLIVLEKNYRSTQNILDLVRTIILKGEDRLENILSTEITKELQAHRNEQGTIIEKEFPTSLHELVYIAKEIKKLSIPLNEIALIAPKHKLLEEAAKILDYFKIPVAYERKQNLLEHKLIAEIIKILKFINSLNKIKEIDAEELLPQILSFPFFEINKIDIWKISIEAKKNRKKWLEIMLEHENLKIQNIAKLFITLNSESNNMSAEEIIDRVTGVSETTISENEIYTSPFKEYYFSKNNFENNKIKYLDYLTNLQSFIQAVRGHKGAKTLTLQDVLTFSDLHEKHNISLNHNNFFNNEKKAVNLLTVHKAKGQEFDTVFVLNCQDDTWITGKTRNILPLPKNIPLTQEGENTDDKLRLFYVALTRAKNTLHLTHHQYKDSGKEQVKLRFLEETVKKAQGVHPQKIQIIQQEFIEKEGLENLLETKLELENHEIKNTDETELIKTLIKDYKLSVTHFNNYLNVADGGPQKFLEQNLLRFPQSQSPASAYGSALHNALHQFQKNLKKTQTVGSLEFLLEQFTKSLNYQRLNDKNLKKLLEKGQKQIPFYYENRKHEFNPEDLAEYDFITQNVNINDARITGKIDKMHYDHDLKEIIVYDYKTGKPIHSWEKGSAYDKVKSWKYKNQLIFYKLLVENARDFKQKYKVNKGILEFLEPDNDETILLSLNINHEEVEQMKKLIEVVYKKIINLEFPDTSMYEPSYYGIRSFIEDLLSEA